MEPITLDVIIARTIEQQDKFAALPETSINLDYLMVFKDGRPSMVDMLQHTPCNSVGCVEGWVQYDLIKRSINQSPQSYLGIVEYGSFTGDYLFKARRFKHMSQRREALERYKKRIEELEYLKEKGMV